MPHKQTPPTPLANPGRTRVWLAGGALALAIAAAYATSFRGVMVFDDFHAIVDNPTIRDLSRPGQIFSAPAEGGTVAGRPVLNFTLALNYALGGVNPAGYHAVNLAIHILAALALFGVVRRTAGRARPLGAPSGAAGASLVDARGRSTAEDRMNSDGTPALLFAFAVAALWALHPLHTGAVTYIVQRAESLAGLFVLLTLYCFIRGAGRVSDPPQSGTRQVEDPPCVSRLSRLWFAASAVSCLLAMGTKEIAAAAPLLVLLFDRAFLAGSFAAALRARWRVHAALFASWILLVALVLSAGGRGGSAGFATSISWWEYALTQCGAIVHYLRLAVWPHPLVFDYGTLLAGSLAEVWWQASLLLLLLFAALWAAIRKPRCGFLAAWFFLILAPSSSIVPVATQTIAEHRMYLPLAAVIALLVLGAYRLAGRRALIGLLVLALGAGILTARRNLVYRSELALWSDTVAHRPANARAHTNLGIALTAAGRTEEAFASFKESLRLDPSSALTHLNLFELLVSLGRIEEAVTHGEEAVRLEPLNAGARASLAGALEALGNAAAARRDFAGAISRYRPALEFAPDSIPARANLANALLVTGHVDEAIAHYREVLRRNPGDRRTQENLAIALEIQRARSR